MQPELLQSEVLHDTSIDCSAQQDQLSVFRVRYNKLLENMHAIEAHINMCIMWGAPILSEDDKYRFKQLHSEAKQMDFADSQEYKAQYYDLISKILQYYNLRKIIINANPELRQLFSDISQLNNLDMLHLASDIADDYIA